MTGISDIIAVRPNSLRGLRAIFNAPHQRKGKKLNGRVENLDRGSDLSGSGLLDFISFKRRKAVMIAWMRKWWKRNIVDDFPHPDECFDCDLGSCEGCEIREV